MNKNYTKPTAGQDEKSLAKNKECETLLCAAG